MCEVCLSKHSPVMFTQQQGKVQQIYIGSSVQNNNVQHITQTHSPSRLYTNQLSYHNCPISKASRIPHITGCLRQLLTSNPYQHKSTAYYYQGQTACCHLGHSLPPTAGNEIFIDSTRSLLNDNQQEVCHAVGLAISPGILCFGCSAEVTLVVLYRSTVYMLTVKLCSIRHSLCGHTHAEFLPHLLETYM